MNRTIMEKTRCMLISAGMKPSLWDEAVMTTILLINRSPSSMVDFKTPQELWTKRKPNLSYLRPFGCIVYSQISQGKLQSRALKCVLLGYPRGVKGYRLLIIQPGGYKIITSRNVTFREDEFHFKTILTSSSELLGTTEDTHTTRSYNSSSFMGPLPPIQEEDEFDT